VERVERGNGREGGGRERRGGDEKGRERGDKEIVPDASGVICSSLLLPSILTILRVVSLSELEGGRTTESRRPILIESCFCSTSLATFSTIIVSTFEVEGTIGGEERVGERERGGGEGEREGESEEEEGDAGDFEGEGWRVCRG
jgi:hypothetical protein